MFYDTEDLKDGEIQLRLERTAEGNPEKNWVPAYYFGICLADGEYLETADIPEDHDMYERGLRQVMVYRFDLDRGENEDGTN